MEAEKERPLVYGSRSRSRSRWRSHSRSRAWRAATRSDSKREREFISFWARWPAMSRVFDDGSDVVALFVGDFGLMLLLLLLLLLVVATELRMVIWSWRRESVGRRGLGGSKVEMPELLLFVGLEVVLVDEE